MDCRRVSVTGGKRPLLAAIIKNAGFTYIELLTVMVLISLLAIPVYPLITGERGLGIEIALTVIKSDIEFTRRQAMIDGVSRSVSFTKGEREYTFGLSGDRVTPNSRDLAELDSSVFVDSTLTITFNSLGEPMEISSDTIVTLSRQDQSLSLVIIPHTGKVMYEGS